MPGFIFKKKAEMFICCYLHLNTKKQHLVQSNFFHPLLHNNFAVLIKH